MTIIKPKWRIFWIGVLLALWLLCSGSAQASPLAARLAQYPNWEAKSSVEPAVDDLVYPDWLVGTWTVTTTLVDLVAPLAPELVTPGFDSNQQFLNQSITFKARFVRRATAPVASSVLPPLSRQGALPPLVADRAFNGLNLMRASLNQISEGLGDRLVLSVKVDPGNPNRQVTRMRGDRQLVSTITGRTIDSAEPDRFITTEITQQIFRGGPQPYLNEVETTTSYYHQPSEFPQITADQVTAIYLSPQDPDFFKSPTRPIALYRYKLEFEPA